MEQSRIAHNLICVRPIEIPNEMICYVKFGHRTEEDRVSTFKLSSKGGILCDENLGIGLFYGNLRVAGKILAKNVNI